MKKWTELLVLALIGKKEASKFAASVIISGVVCMAKKLTISVSEEDYKSLCSRVGADSVVSFIDGLVRSHVVNQNVDGGYRGSVLESSRDDQTYDWVSDLIDDEAW